MHLKSDWLVAAPLAGLSACNYGAIGCLHLRKFAVCVLGYLETKIRPCLVSSKNYFFKIPLSYRILRHINEILNIDKINN